MSSMYSKRHYEDMAIFVAELPSPGSTPGPVKAIEVVKRRIAERLADRFAADNPTNVYCGYCGTTEGNPSVILCPERGLGLVHSFIYHKGFDRERFLAACGLEPESKDTHLPSDILGREY